MRLESPKTLVMGGEHPMLQWQVIFMSSSVIATSCSRFTDNSMHYEMLKTGIKPPAGCTLRQSLTREAMIETLK